jgi:tetratricopeptide (TPR) repeat protein
LLVTDPLLAAQQAQEILRVDRAHSGALRLLASAQRACDEPETALPDLVLLAQSHPRSAQVQLDLGLALAQAGRGIEALAALRRAAARDPRLPGVWRALGEQLAVAGDEQGASDAYLAHVRHSTADPQLMRAADALAGGRLPEAETLLRARLKRAPTDVAAIRMLAELAARLGRYRDAVHLLERCLELAPAFRAARLNLAQVLQRDNQPQQALAHVEALLAEEPRNPAYRNLQAVILSRLGDYAAAIALYRDLLQAHGGHPKLWMSYGHTLKTAGDTQEAITAYRRCVATDPGFGEAWWSLANLKTFRFDPADIETMRAQLARPELAGKEPAEEDRLHLHFALGKALEDAGDYAGSFRHYQEGNRLRRAQLPWDADAFSRRIAAAQRVYTRDFFAARAGQGCAAPDPIFIVGLPRAGSTLIEQILSSHPMVEGTMELPEILTVTRQLRGLVEGDEGSYHDALARLDGDALRELGEQYLERTRIHRRSGAPMFIDKMPNNFAHIGLIHLILPNARIIDARRHPLACCFSGFKQHFARGQAFSYDLSGIGRYYRDYVALMAHFDAVLPGRVHRIHYEDMVEDTEAQVRRLLAYCGLDFDPRCLRFFENDRPVRTASSEQVRQPIFRDGLEQWRRYELWLDPLKDALGPVLECYPQVPHAVAAQAATYTDFAAGECTS